MGNSFCANCEGTGHMTLFWNDAAARRKALIWGMLGLALVMLLLWPHAAWASDTTGGLPYESYLTKVRQSMTGTVGYTFALRSEEHTSELQSLMRISYAVFCLKKKINTIY